MNLELINKKNKIKISKFKKKDRKILKLNSNLADNEPDMGDVHKIMIDWTEIYKYINTISKKVIDSHNKFSQFNEHKKC